MSRRGPAPEIQSIARGLGLPAQTTTARDLVVYCLDRMEPWVYGDDRISTIAHVEDVVCQRLGLTFEEVWTTDDLERIRGKYLGLRQGVFSRLAVELEGAYAALFALEQLDPSQFGRFVAVVDCRGAKGARRFFSRWHEIAHVLTQPRSVPIPCHRSSPDRDPVERLMDDIAAEIGFYAPLFCPILERQLANDGSLTMAGVEAIRRAYCEDASFQATLIACVSRMPLPAVYLEAGLGYKEAERRQLQMPALPGFAEEVPQPRLRALVVRPNAVVKGSGLRIDTNMEVPSESVIAWLFQNSDSNKPATAAHTGWLGDWRHSDGTSLPDLRVRVEARRLGEKVLAIVMPLADGVGACEVPLIGEA